MSPPCATPFFHDQIHSETHQIETSTRKPHIVSVFMAVWGRIKALWAQNAPAEHAFGGFQCSAGSLGVPSTSQPSVSEIPNTKPHILSWLVTLSGVNRTWFSREFVPPLFQPYSRGYPGPKHPQHLQIETLLGKPYIGIGFRAFDPCGN